MRYLLPCDKCGEKTAIDASQAGRQIVCQCGASLVVPSFRAIRALETIRETPSPTRRRRSWNPVRGATFAFGMVTIVVGILLAAVAGFAWYETDTTEWPGLDLSGAEAEMDKLSATNVLEIWTEMREHGLGPYITPGHIVAQQWVDRYRWVLIVGLLIVAIGVALCAGPVIASRIRRS